MTLVYRLFGIPGNSAEMKDKVDRKIGNLKEKAKKKKERIDIIHFVDAYSLDGITRYNCYINISSKGLGSINVPITSGSYNNKLENDPQVIKRKNNDCASTYEMALDFADRFVKDGLAVLVDEKPLAEIKDMIPKIRNGEIQQKTIIVPEYEEIYSQ